MLARTNYSSDQIVANKAERVYEDLYQDEYETKFSGQYVALDVLTRRAYVAESPVVAIILARADDPNGLFHVIQIPPASESSAFISLVARLRSWVS